MGENRYGSIRSITYNGEKVKIQNSAKMTEMQGALQAAGRHKKDRVVDLGDLRKELNIQTSPVTISITANADIVNKKFSTSPSRSVREALAELLDSDSLSGKDRAILERIWLGYSGGVGWKSDCKRYSGRNI